MKIFDYTIGLLGISAAIINFYCGIQYKQLYDHGWINSSRRISLKRLNEALNKAKPTDDIKDIEKCKVWYKIYLVVFYLFILFIIVRIGFW
jgi:hypothetical protein